jgi:hypothetical protein
LMRAIRPPLERYILFQLERARVVFSTTPFQLALSLNRDPNGRPKYGRGKEPIPQP